MWLASLVVLLLSGHLRHLVGHRSLRDFQLHCGWTLDMSLCGFQFTYECKCLKYFTETVVMFSVRLIKIYKELSNGDSTGAFSPVDVTKVSKSTRLAVHSLGLLWTV